MKVGSNADLEKLKVENFGLRKILKSLSEEKILG